MLKYFNENLQIKSEYIEEVYNSITTEDNFLVVKKEISDELLEVNKLLTIRKYLSKKSKFYKDLFYNKITNILYSENDIIPYFGIAMSKDSFKHYLNKYNDEYKIE